MTDWQKEMFINLTAQLLNIRHTLLNLQDTQYPMLTIEVARKKLDEISRLSAHSHFLQDCEDGIIHNAES